MTYAELFRLTRVYVSADIELRVAVQKAFPPLTRVVHEKFGEGQVIKNERPMAPDCVQVRFDVDDLSGRSTEVPWTQLEKVPS